MNEEFKEGEPLIYTPRYTNRGLKRTGRPCVFVRKISDSLALVYLERKKVCGDLGLYQVEVPIRNLSKS